ncbi:aminotransferase-like domain-containing protein [Brevibacterium luteolum]|uniref:aminotransferase-like domain-containing protein n=1 Tax=Brevibacterium luteolum TaxID=199591 RepID=UPI00223AFDC5|nr:PLP-dependent aminotransferase family protein [Brevibacterium luteolum]MCT1874646.1 PLP-dependent aminotransferase family protein [Brevibacterium luteolum]MCT1889350.1 PLP-dependent aminotransferase family protein [Brevibacterium luteolum]MCT1892582.1 PLP-dependent aminotransferase family protein [Brevibacterium luteolum]MCT1925199.1 PLP-dependent aminotransferase family protein [Brevibacterium luteolum]
MTPLRHTLNHHVMAVGESPIRRLFEIAADPSIISFAGGHPAEELFDVAGLSAAYAHVFATAGPRAMQYGSTDGEPEMREAAAARLHEANVPTAAHDMMITSGSQQGLGLIAQAVFNPGDVVLVESPTYMSALQAFAVQGVEFKALDRDEAGIVPEALAAAIQMWNPKAVYLIPTFQNPTGISMPASRRQQIADVLAGSDVWLIEDDPYSELRFTDDIQTPISADPRLDDRSLLLGSLSKVLSPGVRIGWIRCPDAELRERIGVTKQATALQTSTIDQLAAAHYLSTHDMEEVLTPVRAEYKARMLALVEELSAVLPEGSVMNQPAGGMFVWARLPEGYDTQELVFAAAQAGVLYVPGPPFYVADPDPRTLRFSFVSNDVETTREGVRRLATVLKDARPLAEIA